MTIVNLTPHAITLISGYGEWHERSRTIEASGTVARVKMNQETQLGRGVDLFGDTGDIVPVVTQNPGEVVDLPEPQEGVTLLVSAMVRTACPHRRDLASPGALVRDDEGRVIGCAALVVN